MSPYAQQRRSGMIGSVESALQRFGWTDAAIAAAASVVAVLYMASEVDDPKIKASIAAVPLFLAVPATLLWRRRAPLAALGGLLVAVLVHAAIFGTDVIRCGIVIPVSFALAYAAGARLPRRDAIVGLVLAEAAVVGMILLDGADGIIGAIPLVTPLILVLWGIGRVAHSRSGLVATLTVRNADLRAARTERARLEVATERARIAGALDELLQRRLADLATLAESSQEGQAPAATAAALAQIEREGRATLDQMRDLVGELRDEATGLPTAPQPTLTELEGLLVRAKGAGARLTVQGSPRALPPGVELSAYRIVEALLEALADTPAVVLDVRFADDVLELALSGGERSRSEVEASLRQARERVALQHGTLSRQVDRGRAELRISLPVLATG
jgi:hypothetical protein